MRVVPVDVNGDDEPGLIDVRVFYNLPLGYQRSIERWTRRVYADERRAPEWVDLGGEG